MVGTKPFERTVEVKSEGTATVDIVLSEAAKQLSEIVVSSGRQLNKRPVAIGKVAIAPMDMPQAVTVIGQGIIREQQALRLSDVIKNVNGVYLSSTRGAVQESFAARGYTFGSNNLFKNGARINSGIFPEISGLERVEVLKGSAAILFGQVAPGGIINMVTKQPKFTQGGEVSVQAGSYDLYKPSIDVYGPLSSSVAYRMNGTYESAGSFRDNVTSKRYYVNPSLLFKLGNRTNLLVQGDYLYSRFTPDFGIGTIDNTKIPGVPRSRFMGAAWQYNVAQQTTATATLNHQLSKAWTLSSILSYQLYKRDYYSTERVMAAANGDWVRPLGKILSDETYYTGQVNLTGKFNTGRREHTLLTGIDADRYLTNNNDFSFPTVTGLAAGSYDKINILAPGKYTQRADVPTATTVRKRTAPVGRFGAYVQDLVKLSSKFNVLAGIRWSYVATFGIDSVNLLNNSQTKGKGRYDAAFSPRVGVVYKPSNNTSVFASYSNSFVTNTGQDIYGAAIKPSLVDQYEVGVKNELLNGRVSANVTAYRIKNNNLAQTAPFLPDGTSNTNTNIKMLSGETTSDGIEVDLAAHPVNGLNIAAGYSYNYIRYTKTDTTVVGSFITGERLVANPAHTANASVFYTFGNGALKGFKAGVMVVYAGDRNGGWNTDRVIVNNKLQNRSRLFRVSGYTTLDLSAGYTCKKVSLLAKVSNLTNALAYIVQENYSVNPIAPSQVVATVSYKF